MALENLVDGMTGLQMADAIKSNFDKVLNAESAENKAENAGKSIKTDYDATRYIELQLADGTPVKMKMDVFCQAIAPVVAGVISPLTFKGLLGTSDNADDISDGIFYTANMNNPSGLPNAYNNIIVQLTNKYRGDRFQILYSMNNNLLYYRGKASGDEWLSWRVVAVLE